MGYGSESRLGTVSCKQRILQTARFLFGVGFLLLAFAFALPQLLSGAYFLVGFAFVSQFFSDLTAGNWGVLGESFMPLLRLIGYGVWWVALAVAGIGFLRNLRQARPWLVVALLLPVLLLQPWKSPQVRMPPGYTQYTP